MAPTNNECKPQNVLVFVIGGTTYEEARAVALLKQKSSTAGSHIYCSEEHVYTIPQVQFNKRAPSADLHFDSYVEMIRSAVTQFPALVFEPSPEAATGIPALNLDLGGVNVSQEVEFIGRAMKGILQAEGTKCG